MKLCLNGCMTVGGGDMYSALMLLSLVPVLNWIDANFSDTIQKPIAQEEML
jgi:hypothetical protein